MSLRLLRESIWDSRSKLNRTALMSAPSTVIERITFITISRLVITGGSHQRLHEELTYSATQISESGSKRIRTNTEIDNILQSATPISIETINTSKVKDMYVAYQDDLMANIERRSQERLTFLQSTLARREEQEVNDISNVLDELAQGIEIELREPEPEQLDLWAPEQKQLRKRNLSAIEERAKRIPEEKQREISEIKKRYANPVSRTFPVAVITIIPESMVAGELS